MADATYPLAGQGNREEQGGKSWVIGSTGTLTIEAGGTLAISTGATFSMAGALTVASTGALIVADGAQIAEPVTVKSTSTGTITNFGITTFGSTSANSYTLAHPDRAGLRKTLLCTVHGATTISSVVVTASTASFIRNTTAVAQDAHTLTFLSAGTFAELISVSTSEWRLLSTSAANVALT